jgi:hypothetical protein
MPNIAGMPITKYQPLWAYHHYYDNLPIEDIEDQLFVVNAQVDLNEGALADSIGSAGSLANRLNQSLEEDGSLKTTAIDDALHSIAEHLDAGGYVRMTDVEQSKLNLIDSEATNLSIAVETVSTTLIWPTVGQIFKLVDSDTVTWRVEDAEVYADTAWAKSLVVLPSYNITPVLVSGYVYKTTSVNTPYKAGSLRVYINGLRLNTTANVGGYKYTETSPTLGTFTLNKALGSGDVFRIDFDQPLT